MNLAECLAELAAGRQRVQRADLWRAFQRCHPVEATAGDARDRLARRLTELAASGAITLPSERGSAWDRSARPPLPEWVALPRVARPAPRVDTGAVTWAPELAFLATQPTEHLDAALAIQHFLATGGRDRPLVPLRERSVQLFGDEKRLERLLRTPLFAAGRLTPMHLRCFPMAPPLVFEAGPPGRPSLVVENHHTWWSFCRWNARTAAYSAVVYGAGGAFGRDAVTFLAEHCRTWGASHAEYFGDLDGDGIRIPARAASTYAGDARLRIVPAEQWYRLLLTRAAEVALPVGVPFQVEAAALGWLPPAMASEAASWFARGVRIPQELVGTDELAAQVR